MNAYKEYKGLPIVEGTVVAPIVIIDSSDFNVKNEEVMGKIAIIRVADPAIVLWLKSVVGLVVERGGVVSHGAILAREFNIPCIVGVNGIYDQDINGLMGSLYSNQGVLKIWLET